MRVARTVIVAMILAVAVNAGAAACTTSDPARQQESCRAEFDAAARAIEAWHALAPTNPTTYPTPWPTGDDLTFAGLLRNPPTHFTVTGDGTAPPTIETRPGDCAAYDTAYEPAGD